MSGSESSPILCFPILSFLKDPEGHCVCMKRCVHWTNYCSRVLFLTSPLKVPFSGSTEESFFFLTPSLFHALQRIVPTAKRNRILCSPCLQRAMQRVNTAGLKFLISPWGVQTPAGGRLAGRFPGRRHWDTEQVWTLYQSHSILRFQTVQRFPLRTKEKGGKKATSQFSSWLCTHLQLCQLFWRFLQSLKCLTGFLPYK